MIVGLYLQFISMSGFKILQRGIALKVHVYRKMQNKQVILQVCVYILVYI